MGQLVGRNHVRLLTRLRKSAKSVTWYVNGPTPWAQSQAKLIWCSFRPLAIKVVFGHQAGVNNNKFINNKKKITTKTKGKKKVFS